MESPDYMILNPMRIIILKIPKEFKLRGEILIQKNMLPIKKSKKKYFWEFL
jgi:hypothetical protein